MVFSMDPEHPQAVRELIGSRFQNLPDKDQYTDFKGREEAFLRGQPAEHMGPDHSESLSQMGLDKSGCPNLGFHELEHSVAII